MTISSLYELTRTVGDTITGYSIDWGDGTTPTSHTGTSSLSDSIQVAHPYSASGPINPTIIVKLFGLQDTYAGVASKNIVVRPSGLVEPRVTGVSTSNTQATVSWDDCSNSEVGFFVETSTDGTNFDYAGWAPANSTSCQVTGLTPNTSYLFRVVAYNDIGSATSVPFQKTTTNVSPSAPTSLTARATSSSQVELAWTVNPASQQNGFKIEQSTDGVTFTQVAKVVGSSCTTATISYLSPNTTYYFRVRAYVDNVGDSSYCPVAKTKTIPAAPTTLTADAMSTSQVQLTWTGSFAFPVLTQYSFNAALAPSSQSPTVTQTEDRGGVHVKDDTSPDYSDPNCALPVCL